MAAAANERLAVVDDDRGQERAGPTRYSRPGQHSVNRFNSVILDVDSTLSGVEGIDWLASKRGSAMEAAVASLTEQAMQGAIPLESVYGERLKMVRPTKAEI